MTWTRLGKILALLLAAGVLFVAVVVGGALLTPLIALVALAALVAGGNWLNSYMGVSTRKPQQFKERPSTPGEEAEDAADGDAP